MGFAENPTDGGAGDSVIQQSPEIIHDGGGNIHPLGGTIHDQSHSKAKQDSNPNPKFKSASYAVMGGVTFINIGHGKSNNESP